MSKSDHLQEAISKANGAVFEEVPHDLLYAQLAIAHALIALVERLDALTDTGTGEESPTLRVSSCLMTERIENR